MDEYGVDKTTLRDVGVGMVLLGSFILLLTLVFFVMSFLDQKHYGLFSGETHLLFDTVLGIAFLVIGAAIARKEATGKNGARE